MEGVVRDGRSLAETPTWSVATVTTVMVFMCLLVQRSLYRFGRWLKKTRRKALFASLEKIKEEMMLLGLISLLLGQWASAISQICVDSSLYKSRFLICSEEDYGITKHTTLTSSLSLNETVTAINNPSSQHCGEGREPFVSLESLEQLHRFLFVLGITHVLYSCIAVGLALSKIYSWRKWEVLASLSPDSSLQAKKIKVMRRQATFILHYASHPWSKNRILIWMLCFFKQFKSSMQKSDYFALRLGFITVGISFSQILWFKMLTKKCCHVITLIIPSFLLTHRLPLSYNFHNYIVRSMEDEFYGIVGISWPLWGYAIICIFVNIHGLNIYFWLSFLPVILVMLVGTKLQHVVSLLALEIVEPMGGNGESQIKPRNSLFWFGKPDILLRLIQFISFQNAFEMATFIWSLWGIKQRSCFMKNHAMIVVRLTSGVVVQFWCSYSTVPLNIIISQMGSRAKKALIAENVRESLHSWCKRVKERSKHNTVNSITTRSTCSLGSTIDEGDEIVTVASATLSPCSSTDSLHQMVDDTMTNEQPDFPIIGSSRHSTHELSLRVSEYASYGLNYEIADNVDDDGGKVETLFNLLKRT